MANLAVATAGEIHIVGIPQAQHTARALEAILAGATVRFDVTTGSWMNGNATDATEGNIYGIATKSVAAGEYMTAVRRGLLDGFTITQNFNAPIYVSDTDGRIADAVGTVTIKVGRVVPANSQSLGVTADKLLLVDFAN